MKRYLFLFTCYLLLFLPFSDAQALCSPGSQLQGLVSGRGSTIPTKMPSIVYDSILNQFTISIFNNNEVLSQAQCSNLNGPFFNNPGSSSFSISLACSGSENGGTGVTGGISIAISNSTNTLTSVVISTGNTYPNIPIKLTNGASLANRLCTITLQATLYQILPDNFCFPCANFPIETVQIATGPPGFTGSCCWTCLTCYSDDGILWTSTFMWIWIDLGSAIVVVLCFLIWFIYAKQRKWNPLVAKFIELNSHKITNNGTIDPTSYSHMKIQQPKLKMKRGKGMLYPPESSYPVASSAGYKKKMEEESDYVQYSKPGPTKKTPSGVYHQVPTDNSQKGSKKSIFHNRPTVPY